MKSISIISEKEDDRPILMTGKYLENLKVFWKQIMKFYTNCKASVWGGGMQVYSVQSSTPGLQLNLKGGCQKPSVKGGEGVPPNP